MTMTSIGIIMSLEEEEEMEMVHHTTLVHRRQLMTKKMTIWKTFSLHTWGGEGWVVRQADTHTYTHTFVYLYVCAFTHEYILFPQRTAHTGAQAETSHVRLTVRMYDPKGIGRVSHGVHTSHRALHAWCKGGDQLLGIGQTPSTAK